MISLRSIYSCSQHKTVTWLVEKYRRACEFTCSLQLGDQKDLLIIGPVFYEHLRAALHSFYERIIKTFYVGIVG
jgi:hypothetical protein